MLSAHLLRRAALGLGVSAAIAASLALSLPHTASATNPAGDANVYAANVSDQAFSVIWTTTTKATGSSIEYGTSCAGATTTAAETPSNGFVHLASTAGGLASNTTYFYKLIVNGIVDDNGGNCYRAHTYPSQAVPPPPLATYGIVKNASCAAVAPGSIAVIFVQQPSGSSGFLAAITDANGAYALPFGDATNGSGAYVSPKQGDTIWYVVATDAAHISSMKSTYNGTSQVVPAPTRCLAGGASAPATSAPNAFAKALSAH